MKKASFVLLDPFDLERFLAYLHYAGFCYTLPEEEKANGMMFFRYDV